MTFSELHTQISGTFLHEETGTETKGRGRRQKNEEIRTQTGRVQDCVSQQCIGHSAVNLYFLFHPGEGHAPPTPPTPLLLLLAAVHLLSAAAEAAAAAAAAWSTRHAHQDHRVQPTLSGCHGDQPGSVLPSRRAGEKDDWNSNAVEACRNIQNHFRPLTSVCSFMRMGMCQLTFC